MRIAIWGAGAVGLGLATTLAGPDGRLSLIGRSDETLNALRTKGIRRTGLFGDVHISPERFTTVSSTQGLVDEPPDWLLICTKAWASSEIARALEPIARKLTTRTRLLLCQNGWGNEIPFLRFWPKPRLFHARIITGFQRRSTTEVEITAHAAPIALGSLFDSQASSRPTAGRRSITTLARRISQGGIPTETTDDMRGVLWAKMLYNCALNPLSALAGRRYGELTDDPTTRALLEEVVRETFLVLGAAGIETDWPDAAAYLETFYSELIPPTAAHESSMLQDLRAGRTTEIEALCGAVERLASSHAISTPVVSALAALIRVAERRSRGDDPI